MNLERLLQFAARAQRVLYPGEGDPSVRVKVGVAEPCPHRAWGFQVVDWSNGYDARDFAVEVFMARGAISFGGCGDSVFAACDDAASRIVETIRMRTSDRIAEHERVLSEAESVMGLVDAKVKGEGPDCQVSPDNPGTCLKRATHVIEGTPVCDEHAVKVATGGAESS